jgi:VCBS repeat-containing protein
LHIRAISGALGGRDSLLQIRDSHGARPVYTLYKNASPIGTVTIATSGGFTFATTAEAAQSFVAGDTWSILTPAADATLSSVTMTFAGTR